MLLVALSIGTDLLAQKPDKNKRDKPPAAVVAAFQKAYPNAQAASRANEPWLNRQLTRVSVEIEV